MAQARKAKTPSKPKVASKPKAAPKPKKAKVAKASPPARPFVKWAGGKAGLAARLKEILPRKIKTYYEPFVGGGALFFALAAEKRFQRAALNDWNIELMDAFRAVRNFPEDVIRALVKLKEDLKTDPAGVYQRERAKDPDDLRPLDRAIRFLFLNKTGFNGLYRVNKSGVFNVPFGRYEDPRIVDPGNVRACSEILNKFVVLTAKDFAEVVSEAGPGDAVYFDPPYVPLTATSNFTSYTSTGFGLEDQRRLAATFKQLVEAGAAVVASNSDTEIVRNLYDGFEMHRVMARRAINSKATARGPISELIIVGRPS